jgi:hypothetical protein
MKEIIIFIKYYSYEISVAFIAVFVVCVQCADHYHHGLNGTAEDNGDGEPVIDAGISQVLAIVFDKSDNYYLSNDLSCPIHKVNA